MFTLRVCWGCRSVRRILKAVHSVTIVFIVGAFSAVAGAEIETSAHHSVQTAAGTSDFGRFDVGVYPPRRSVCLPSSARFFVDVVHVRGPSEQVTLAADGLPPGAVATFNANPVTTDGDATLTIQPGAATPGGLYQITIIGLTPVQTEERVVELELVSIPPHAPTPIAPADGASGVPLSSWFTWNPASTTSIYDLSIASDPAMSNEVGGYDEATTTSVRPAAVLFPLTTYYWHVRASNACGASPFSAVRSFTTGSFDCNGNGVEDAYDTFGWRAIDVVASNLNLPIPECDTVHDLAVTDTQVVSDCAPISDVDVTLDITHTYVGDLVVRLLHEGVGYSASSTLVSRIGLAETNPSCSARECCGAGFANLHVRLDDDAFESIESATGSSGWFRPYPSALADFEGGSACGTWTIEVSDNAAGDVGTLLGWGLRIKTPTPQHLDCDFNEVPDECDPDFDSDGQIDACDDDIDNDSLLNEHDVCDYTPPGVTPDANGTVSADLDGDCDVDLEDAAIMIQLFTGPWR